MEILVNRQLYNLLEELNSLRERKKTLEDRESEIKGEVELVVDSLPESWESPCGVKKLKRGKELALKFDYRMGSRDTTSVEALKLLGVSEDIIRRATKTSTFPVIGKITYLKAWKKDQGTSSETADGYES